VGLENVALVAFNRGRVSRLALARTDIKRVAFSADEMTNYMPRVLGSMSLRAGWGYLGAMPSAPRIIPFVFATADTALLEFTNGALRIWVSDALVTRVAVGTTIGNGSFDTDLTSWTDGDEAGGTSVWVTGGYMGLTGNGTAAAVRTQAVTVAAGDQALEHAVRIVVERGPVLFRLGTSSGGDEILAEAELATGEHSLAFTPNAATIHFQFLSRLKRQVLVDSCTIEAAGVMSITSPYVTADLGILRYDQSADVIFVACYGKQQRKVERRATRSWSLVRYVANDGPLRNPNFGPITLTPSALSGNITLTASSALFKSTMAPSTDNDGALMRITSTGQTVTASVTAENTFTNAIRVEGVGAQRTFTVNIAGTWAATVTLQRSSISDTGPWTDASSWTANQTNVAISDGFDNQIIFYRIGVKTGNFTSGTIALSLNYINGSIDGYVRITAFTSSVQVSAEVIVDLGSTDATDDWTEGEWSDRRGWPSATALYEGRLWWASKTGIFGSVSDGFESFDEAVEGDSGSLNREVGSGPVDTINWMLPLSRLILGGEAAELSCKSTSEDEPLTPTNFQIKPDSTQGSAAVNAARIDKQGVFVQNGGTRVFELTRENGVDYDAKDLTVLIPEICEPSVTRLAVQRKPDTRIHCVKSDGTVALAVLDRAENVLCWFDVETRAGDSVLDVAVLPGASGSGEDAVYYAVQRTVNAATVFHLERWALESDCVGGTVNRQADAYVTFTNAPASATVTGLGHLEAEEVVVWTDGKALEDANGDIATFTVNGAAISLTDLGVAYVATTGIVGVAYRARWKSTKLAYAAQGGTALNQRKKFEHLGCILDRTHHKGLRYGPDFDNLSPLPAIERGTAVARGTVHQHYDEDAFEFDGTWGADSRLCLQSDAPRNCTILAATMPIEERAKR